MDHKGLGWLNAKNIPREEIGVAIHQRTTLLHFHGCSGHLYGVLVQIYVIFLHAAGGVG